MNTQTKYQEAIKFATAKHEKKAQKVKGTDLPYVVHLSNVAMEVLIASFYTENFNQEFAIQVALLHDTIEDTETTFEDLKNKFGIEIADAVLALTKEYLLTKEEQMQDSLNRIKKLSPEVWAVKLADRITNLQQPPEEWDNAKRIKYREEARIILNELRGGNRYLEERLEGKIGEYGGYITE